MTQTDHPFQDEDWVVQPGSAEYYAGRQRGNWIILGVIVIFVFLVMGVVMWKWDRAEFYRVVEEREALEASTDAQRRSYEQAQDRIETQE